MATHDGQDLTARFENVRQATEGLCARLSAEDQMVQSMPDASPSKWHLGHTTWFFETFVLAGHRPDYQRVFPEADQLFNSYYESVGAPRARALRDTLSRPSLAEVLDYRRRVTERVVRLLGESGAGAAGPAVRDLVVLGVNHEEQHQELILTDIKHAFAVQPLRPAYHPAPPAAPAGTPAPCRWVGFSGGLHLVGQGGAGFAFDNERPRHRVALGDFELASRLVTCGEYRAFMADGGYRRPELWLSDGWAAAREGGWSGPLYWENRDGEDWQHTLAGMQRVADDEPLAHVSYYEADAFARWAGARLPREAEWERAAADQPVAGNLLESGRLHPAPAGPESGDQGAGHGPGLVQLFGDVWEWTESPYVPYPGYRRAPGALGEYNGKFMCNQLVLRGGSCLTPTRHLRPSYRNFFPPQARWQVSGVRLARDV